MTLMEFLQLLVPSIGVGAIIVFGWKISGAVGELRGQIGGLADRLTNVEKEVHSINDYLRRNEA